MATQLLDHSLGSIACNIPGATRVLRDFHLDFCCGGQKSLRQAALDRGIDAQAVEQCLLALDGQPGDEDDWRLTPLGGLIDHVLQRYHAVHRQQFPELIRLAARVEQVHGGSEHCPLGLTELLIEMNQELDSHMQKEEQILFPMILNGAGVMAGSPIRVMRYEHDQHGDALERIAALTNDIQPPANACNTWRALYRGLEEMRVDLMQHIHLENNLLFPRALAGEA